MVQFSKVKQLLHWGPLLALFIIAFVTAWAVLCTFVWWPPALDDVGSILHMVMLFVWLFLILYNFFKAAFIGPGFVPLGWKPDNPEECKYLQYCKICKGYKAPRSHHCRKCGRCVMKMDHHCPWINTCCGHTNHTRFIYFLFFAPAGCIHGSVIFILTIYNQLYKNRYLYHAIASKAWLTFTVYSFLLTFFALGMAIGVTLSVGFLFVTQVRSIWKNETGIETWIIEKADRPREDEFVYPYNLGWKRNLKEIFTLEGLPSGDGITWPVVDGCNQYTLTVEQLVQKEEKRNRTMELTAFENYSGYVFPITKGFYTCISVPCTDEPRIPLTKGDKILVTRWKKYWLYGDKVIDQEGEGQIRIRGWFPRRCAKEVFNNGMNLVVEEKKDM
ncbi:palmitoyltransferase ZDHHC6-like [Ptychodera flava]|uniref:palmitoyltransferase ZDHHC6-like n=1 Tax=Ptychodera flava TaxID=63121 RepID=UPI00396A5753